MRIFEAMNTVLRRADEESGGDKLLDLLKDPYADTLAQGSVYASLATSIGFTILLALCFSLLRPYNSFVYAPKLKVADEKHAPPPVGKGIFAWVKPILKTNEKDLIPLIGLDATIFLRILRMLRNIFLALTVFGCGILIPVNLLSPGKSGDWSKTTIVSKVTPNNTYGSALFSMSVCAWIFNIIVAGFLWWNYRVIVRLRRGYYESPEYQSGLHARTLMINDIPKEYRSDEGIGRLIDLVVPTSSFSRTAIARNVKELPELIDQHNHTVRELEKYLAKYLKNPEAELPPRPLCKPDKKDPNWGTYPKGQKVDAIEYLTSRIKDLELEIKEVRLTVDNRNPLPYGFASYEDITEAHSIAYTARNKHPEGTTIVLAPRPNDIIWKNMPLSKAQRRSRSLWNSFWVAMLTLVWIAPNALISVFLVRLSNLGKVWPAFQNSLSANTTWWSIVQGVLSPAITSLVYLVLPIIFRRMSIRAGDRTKTQRERHVTAKLYTFFVFNYLIVFSVFGAVWTFVAKVIDATSDGKDAWRAIQDSEPALSLFISLCNISPFWITWLLQRNLGAAVDLAQLWTLFYTYCARKFSSPTPRDLIELTAPPAFDYASYYNYFLFYSTITLCFATLQPLAIPACALYFAVDVYLKKYLLLYIFITKTESGGMFWRMFFNRMIFATIMSNLVVFLAVWVRGETTHMEAYVVIPLPFLMFAFKWYCYRQFDDKIHYYASRTMKDAEAVRPSRFDGTKKDRLATRFGHPVLYRPLITPMVHAKAQHRLPGIYGGRLTDSNGQGSTDHSSVSGYSDTYQLENMAGGKPGRKAAIPGFEMVPESRLDFSYYKTRAEFGDEHGGGGALYGKAEDIVRPDTPGSMWNGSNSPSSRPGTPGSPQIPVPQLSRKPVTGFYDGAGGDFSKEQRPISRYGQRSNSDAGQNLVHGAADMSIATPGADESGRSSPYHLRDDSEERRAPGFLGGGPRGYGNLPQHEESEQDPMSYDYFRGRRTRSPGPDRL